MDLSRYLNKVVNRILSDEWRIGWFKVEENIDINGIKCKYLLYGHSRHFKKYKPVFLSRFLSYQIIPYGAAAIIFVVDYIDISIIEKIINAVKRFVEKTRFTTPEGIEWEVDVAYVAILSREIGRGVDEYVSSIFRGIINGQYMMYEGFRGRVNKRIGLVIVNYEDEEIYSGDDMFSREAHRLFNPKSSILEKITKLFHKEE